MTAPLFVITLLSLLIVLLVACLLFQSRKLAFRHRLILHLTDKLYPVLDPTLHGPDKEDK